MRTKLFAVQFSRELGRFDEAELAAFLTNREIDRFREHVIDVDGEPYLLCVVSWRDSPADAATAPRHAATPTTRAASSARPTGPARPMQDVLQGLTDEQRDLYEVMRRWRAQKAFEEGAPAYVLFTNRQLAEIARARPDTRAGLGHIEGIGERKLDRYGKDLLALLWPEVPAAEPVAAVAAATAADADIALAPVAAS